MPTLKTAYLPPIEYFVELAKYSVVYMEACENYVKQSYRNRCYFYSANGREMLQVPIVHDNGKIHIPIREVRVDYSTPWVVRTERAIDSAYKSSAYFDYYRDGLFSILESKPKKLWDLNMALIEFFSGKLGLEAKILPTVEFSPEEETIHPKKASGYKGKPYFQVFSSKYGFIDNLSIMDLLFNEGPQAAEYLRQASSML